jgi:5-methylcytosine-specific restriction enzyme A
MADWPYNTKAWQRLRRVKLSTSPLCEGCAAMGIVVPANTVDHRVPVSEGGNPFPPLEELATYCPPCHSAKTARGSEAGAVRTRKPRKGCNADGSPLDPLHPWHAKPKSVGKLRRKSLRADASGPASEINLELVSNQPGQRPALDLLDDSLDGIWA